MNKFQILQALTKFAKQRPGLEFGNYGDVSSYRSEMRGITRSWRDYCELAQRVAGDSNITGNDLVSAATGAYSGRLSIVQSDDSVCIDYCTGQYWPTEYRNAACAVLASALWRSVLSNGMPKPCGRITRTHGPFTSGHDSIEGLTPGDWMRRYFRREFGRGIASRWFN